MERDQKAERRAEWKRNISDMGRTTWDWGFAVKIRQLAQNVLTPANYSRDGQGLDCMGQSYLLREL